MTPDFATRMDRVTPNAIGELLALGADRAIISFGGGYPDPTLFPTEALAQVFDAVIRTPGGASMQYAPSDGLPRLREQVAELMTDDGTPCTADDVLILQGSQQGLDFTARMLVDPGEPSSAVASPLTRPSRSMPRSRWTRKACGWTSSRRC